MVLIALEETEIEKLINYLDGKVSFEDVTRKLDFFMDLHKAKLIVVPMREATLVARVVADDK